MSDKIEIPKGRTKEDIQKGDRIMKSQFTTSSWKIKSNALSGLRLSLIALFRRAMPYANAKRRALPLAFAIILSFFSVTALYAQTERNSKYIAWFTPSKATDIYGIRFNALPIENEIPSHIFGIELNICPVVVGTFGMAFPYFFMKSTYDIRDNNLDEINFGAYKKVYGLQIGPLSYESSVICGLDINLMSLESKVNGVTISAFTAQHDVVNGLAISVFGNNDIQCNGAQVGLFNTCSDLRGFQFGLWNKNQKRALPIINWNFSKKTNKTPAYPE